MHKLMLDVDADGNGTLEVRCVCCGAGVPVWTREPGRKRKCTNRPVQMLI